jgi:hypothetical protein
MHLTRTDRFVVAGFACAALMTACSGTVTVGGNPEVSQSDVESQVATQLAAETSQPLPKITCPSGLQAKVGASIDCTLTAQGATTRIRFM